MIGVRKLRKYPDWIKTTLKEDAEILGALATAITQSPNRSQIEVLSSVKQHHLDGNRDLREFLWEQFLGVLETLNVRRPNMKGNSRDPEHGSWYPIPALGKRYRGQDAQARLANRKAKRQHFWMKAVSDLGLDLGEVDLLLEPEDSTLGRFRDEIVTRLDKTDRTNQQWRDEVEEALCEVYQDSIAMIEHLRAEIEQLQSLLGASPAKTRKLRV